MSKEQGRRTWSANSRLEVDTAGGILGGTIGGILDESITR